MRFKQPAAVAVVLAALVVGGCSSSDGVELSELGAEGRELALSRGCSACHGQNGEGGVGPAWIGLFGSEVELESGETKTADDGYVRTSIVDPEFEVVAGSTITMPTTPLSEAEVDALVAYIKELQ